MNHPLQLKVDEIRLIAKQSNTLTIRISESKLDSFILNNEVDVDVIRMDYSRRGCGVTFYIRKPLS